MSYRMQVNRRDKIPKFVPLNDIVKLLRNAMIPPSQLPVEPDKRFPVSIKGVLLVDGAKVVLAVVASGTRGFLQGRAYVYLLRALGVLLLFFAGVLLLDGWRLLAG